MEGSSWQNNNPYDEEKALQVLSSFIRLSNNNLDNYTATCLMYLFERENLLKTGGPALFGTMVCWEIGPVIKEVAKDIMGSKTDNKSELLSTYINFYKPILSIKNGYNDTDLLSIWDEELITSLYNKFFTYNFPSLVGYMWGLPEYENIGEETEISYYDFFIKNDFSESDSKELIEEINYWCEIRKLSKHA